MAEEKWHGRGWLKDVSFEFGLLQHARFERSSTEKRGKLLNGTAALERRGCLIALRTFIQRTIQ
jgi:hypothetical protein